ncbi:MAG: DUF3367 domain-containing protein [Actinobacteria bacterium]|nr:DUF3367 domain-containing protein [Actinomycetota bacterium]
MRKRADGPGSRRASPEALASWAVCLALTAATFAQAPGEVIPETKLDVALDPVRYLARALSAWDPSAGFGRIQNQAVGYLFPMGPFFALGRGLGVPPWITQRAWVSLLLVAGYLGAHRLARALGVGSAPGRVVAGLAYTLSAASLATVAFQSAGQLPYVLAPWVLVPLVEARADRSPRRAAARSALAVLAMGGVNGAATLAVLPLAAVWFLTREGGRDRRRLVLWWVAGVAAATAWWAIALAVSVRYGLRFTALTEQASITTSTESATELWRGTGNWLGHLETDGGRWLPGAWAMVSSPVAVVASIVVAVGGALGLARRDAPGRAWLLPSALLGAVAIGIGYDGAAGGSFGPLVQQLLDGPLVAFRNVHKFSAVVRLPLAIGLGHLVATVGARSSASERRPVPAEASGRRPVPAAVAATAVALVAVVLAGFPLVTGSLTAPGGFDEIPPAWHQAARWVDAHDGTTRTLLLPGAAFAENTWGRPLDEPWGVLADGSWAVRDLIPLGGNGSTRLLDGLDAALAGDELPDGFVAALQRAGVGHLVVRNDLDLPRTGGPAPATVRRLLATEPRLRRVASFGPRIRSADAGGDLRLAATAGDLAPADLRQIEVYAVPDPAGRAAAYPVAGRLVVGGAAEAMVSLPGDLVAGRAALLDDDGGEGAALAGDEDRIVVATDTARRRDVDFGSVRANATYTLEAGEPSPFTDGEVQDRWADDEAPELTVARLEGARSITSDGGQGDVGPGHQPFAAFDGDRTTTWTPAAPAVGRWVQVTLDRPRRVPSVRMAIPATEGERIRSVRVVTDGGSRTVAIGPDGTAAVATPPGDTTFVRIEVAEVTAGQVVATLGLSEVELEGVALARPLVAVSDGPADVAQLVRATSDPQALDGLEEDASLDRVVELAAGRDWGFSGTASAVPGPALDAALAAVTPSPRPDAVRATGTAAWADRPGRAPSAAIDGDPDTAWVTGRSLTAPVLDLAWDGPVTVERIRIRPLATGTDRVRSVRIAIGDRRYQRRLPASGVVSIPATEAEALSITFDPGRAVVHRVGIAEVEVDGLAGRHATVPDRDAEVGLPCGSGPVLVVDGNPQPTRAQATAGELLDGSPVGWSSCDPLALEARAHRITGSDGDDGADGALRIDRLTAAAGPGARALAAGGPPTDARRVRVADWGATERTVAVGPGTTAVLATTENRNDGWTATLDGRSLRAIQVDGWRQGFVVPAGDGGRIELRFTPAPVHRAGIAVGVLGGLALAGAALVGGRRRGALAAGWTPPAERAWGDPVLIGLGVAVGLALGGPVVLAFGLLLVLPDRTRRLPVVIVAALVAAGAVVLVAGPGAGVDEGSFSATAQVLSTVAWLALAASAVSAAWPVRSAASAGAGSTRSTRDPSDRPPPGSGSTPAGTG